MAELKATQIGGNYTVENGVTAVNVNFIYESTAVITTAAHVGAETLKIIGLVPKKPPGGGQNFGLRSCSVNAVDGNKNTYTVSASYDDHAKQENGRDAGKGGKGNDFGGGRGACLPPDKETTTTIRAMKDVALKNSCGTPVMPSPQIEVTLLQRTVTTFQLGTDKSQAKKDLMDGVGKIDLEETEKQNAALGIDLRDEKHCPPDSMSPAPGADEDARFNNRPCGSLLQGGSVGDVQQGPCGPYFAITKTFIDGDFQAMGIYEADYTKCGYGGNNQLHTGVHNGQVFPIVALKGIGGVMPWPGQPGIKK